MYNGIIENYAVRNGSSYKWFVYSYISTVSVSKDTQHQVTLKSNYE